MKGKEKTVFSKIMVPVDLAHKDKQTRALQCSADLAAHYGASVVFVGATTETPSSVAHNPTEFKEKLTAFAQEQAAAGNFTAETHVELSHDPTTDLDDALLRAVSETKADLVVMASHIPGLAEYVWPSNGGKVAAHAKCSVFVIRG